MGRAGAATAARSRGHTPVQHPPPVGASRLGPSDRFFGHFRRSGGRSALMAEQSVVPVKEGSSKLQRRDPFALFDELQDEMNRFWGRDWMRFSPFSFARPMRRAAMLPATWTPSMD